MRAIEVPAFGGPEVLRVVERDAPVAGPGDLLVRIEAVGLNWSDLLQRAGLYPKGPKPPFIAGQEAAAVVVGHGKGVGSPALGTAVVVLARTGLAAEVAVVPAEACIPLDGPAADRAAVPISLATAYHALVTCAHATAGETVLVHAAGGALGTIAVQLARCLGLRVIATCSATKRGRVMGLGADLACSYDDFSAARDADIVLDSVGGDIFRRSCDLVRPRGRIVVIGSSSGYPQRIDPQKLVHRSLSVIGFHLQAFDPREALTACRPWLAEGRIGPQVDRVLPLSQMRAAHEILASRATFGKVVLAT